METDSLQCRLFNIFRGFQPFINHIFATPAAPLQCLLSVACWLYFYLPCKCKWFPEESKMCSCHCQCHTAAEHVIGKKENEGNRKKKTKPDQSQTPKPKNTHTPHHASMFTAHLTAAPCENLINLLKRRKVERKTRVHANVFLCFFLLQELSQSHHSLSFSLHLTARVQVNFPMFNVRQ